MIISRTLVVLVQLFTVWLIRHYGFWALTALRNSYGLYPGREVAGNRLLWPYSRYLGEAEAPHRTGTRTWTGSWKRLGDIRSGSRCKEVGSSYTTIGWRTTENFAEVQSGQAVTPSLTATVDLPVYSNFGSTHYPNDPTRSSQYNNVSYVRIHGINVRRTLADSSIRMCELFFCSKTVA